jgi:hypothetical protein
MEPIVYLNAAFCERHRKACPRSRQLKVECGRAERLMAAYDRACKEAVQAL